jgi:hypothetical protein
MSFWKPGQSAPPKTPSATPGNNAKSPANSNSSSNSKTPQNMTSPPASSASSTSSSGSKLTLSKSVMGMKFMKRKEEGKEDMASREAKRAKLLEADEWTHTSTGANDGNNTSTLVAGSSSSASSGIVADGMDIDTDSLRCTVVDVYADVDMLPGRRSFGGFNKPVERQYTEALDRLLYNAASSSSAVSNGKTDDEILEEYEQLIGLPRGPTQGRRQETSSFSSRNGGNNQKRGKQSHEQRDKKTNPNKDGVVMKKIGKRS